MERLALAQVVVSLVLVVACTVLIWSVRDALTSATECPVLSDPSSSHLPETTR